MTDTLYDTHVTRRARRALLALAAVAVLLAVAAQDRAAALTLAPAACTTSTPLPAVGALS